MPIISDRGSLDPLAYWLFYGWSENEFYKFTRTKLEDHYKRYIAAIHFVTAADGALPQYINSQNISRPETPEQAINIDRLLQRIWGNHPNYLLLGNDGADWLSKSDQARKLINKITNAL